MSDIDLLFVIPLAIGLVAGYVANKFNDEIADLGIVISIVSLIVGIIFAPWQLQLLLFVLVIVGARRLWKPNSSNSTSEEFTAETIGKNTVTSSLNKTRSSSNKTEGTMLRTYRGVSYEVSVTPEPRTPKEIGGTYRGKPWTTRNQPILDEEMISHSDLKYRGVRWTLEVPQKFLNLVRDRGN
jgi:uncharacterized membrane protein YeaQ/YmgE (transglycosylase-associated protein family)